MQYRQRGRAVFGGASRDSVAAECAVGPAAGLSEELAVKASRWKRLALWWVVAGAVLAALALTMPLSRERVIAGGAIALGVATVIALYERPADGPTSRKPTG